MGKLWLAVVCSFGAWVILVWEGPLWIALASLMLCAIVSLLALGEQRAQLRRNRDQFAEQFRDGHKMARQVDWKLAADRTSVHRMFEELEELREDSQIAHQWFAKHFGDVMNGRDFAVKCAMADVAMAELRADLILTAVTATKTGQGGAKEPV